MIATLLKPIVLTFATSAPVKKLLIDVLRKLASTTDNTVDDAAVDFIEQRLFQDKLVIT
jgi:hypothetical protein|tara:strand:+ start:30 stop:206 length:177 start_codon:yes stop_codon:yes gene_type:complete